MLRHSLSRSLRNRSDSFWVHGKPVLWFVTGIQSAQEAVLYPPAEPQVLLVACSILRAENSELSSRERSPWGHWVPG